MATQNFSVAPVQTTDAQFRTWALALHTALAAILTYVVQTGEIDFTTVLTPSATNQKRGFRVYRFADALQSTHPVFIRIDFGSGAAATTPCIWGTVGQTVDGSGNIGMVYGGTAPTALQLLASSSSGTASTSYVSGDSSRITICLFMDLHTVGQAPPTLNVERVKDNSGLNLVDAVAIEGHSGGSGGGAVQAMTPDGVTLSCLRGSGSASFPYADNRTSSGYALKVSIFSLIFFSKNATYNGITGILFYHNLDFGGGALTISVYGSSINYILVGRGQLMVDGTATHKFMIRND